MLNGIELEYDHKAVGDLIIKAAQGIVDEAELGAWLRNQVGLTWPNFLGQSS